MPIGVTRRDGRRSLDVVVEVNISAKRISLFHFGAPITALTNVDVGQLVKLLLKCLAKNGLALSPTFREIGEFLVD